MTVVGKKSVFKIGLAQPQDGTIVYLIDNLTNKTQRPLELEF